MMRESEKRAAAAAFLNYWGAAFPGIPLVGHRLREALPERWLRIHSLPDGKRYADTEDEQSEILRRHNTVVDDLIGLKRPYHLVFGYFGDEESIPRTLKLALDQLDPVPLKMLDPSDSDKVQAFPLFMATDRWTTGRLDVVLRAVADDVLDTPLLIGVEQNCVIAPYDGGMDIFVTDQSRRDALRERYSRWLSSHPAGL